MVGTAGLLETIWIGDSSGDIVQVPDVEAEPSDAVCNVGAPAADIAIGDGAIWVSVGGPPAWMRRRDQINGGPNSPPHGSGTRVP
ncbi:MAG TPA: hypothetical protein VFW51_02040 [Actinomycetota bacterium]|nr:hypothetical protein [Actinomycetota bacterium]